MRIEKLGERGVGIARLHGGVADGKVVMVPFTAPGDVGEIQILHETSSYAHARMLRLVEPSADRVEPPCPVFGECGGCSLQHIRYERQLEHKRSLLQEVFRACAPAAMVEPVAPSGRELGYRNKLQMQAGTRGNRLIAGFYRAHSHEIVEVSSCLLQSDAANALARGAVDALRRHGIGASRRGGRGGELRDIVVRESSHTGEMLLTLVTSQPRLRHEDAISRELFRAHPALRGFYLFHNPHDSEYVFKDGERAGLESRGSPLRRVHGGRLLERLGGCTLETSPLSFFQVNTGQAERVIERMAGELGEEPRGLLVDAYAGVGALSLPLAGRFREIAAIESVRHSCELARENAKRNGIRGYRVRLGDAGELLERALVGQPRGGEPSAGLADALILDPPRAGLSRSVSSAVAGSGVPLVFYLSCDPPTQARDVAFLANAGGYRVLRIAPFDMFPQTFHVECLVVLRKERT